MTVKIGFLDRFTKNLQISNFLKICPVEAELFHADGQRQTGRRRYMTKLIIAFRNFADAPKRNITPIIFAMGELCVI